MCGFVPTLTSNRGNVGAKLRLRVWGIRNVIVRSTGGTPYNIYTRNMEARYWQCQVRKDVKDLFCRACERGMKHISDTLPEKKYHKYAFASCWVTSAFMLR